MNIAAAINQNRLALLRMVFCWLAVAYCVSAPRHKYADKPLPKRVALWVDGLIAKAEKATAYLLIAVYYQSIVKKRRNLAFEKAAHSFMAQHQPTSLRSMHIPHIISRLKALQSTLLNLEKTARQLSKCIRVRTRITAMKVVANTQTKGKLTLTKLLEEPAPP